MFLRSNRRFKDGKEHRYRNIVENKRCAGGQVRVPVNSGHLCSLLLLRSPDSHDNGSLSQRKGGPMGSVLSLGRSEYSVVLLPTKPSVDVTMLSPDGLENDPAPGEK